MADLVRQLQELQELAHALRNYWKEWAILGIVEIHSDYKKRYHSVFSLEEVGIEVQPVEERVETTEEMVEGESE